MKLGIRLHAAQAMFFDRAKVLAAADRATRQVLGKFGAFVRTTARHSIRKRRGASAPGSPPSSHTGLLKRFIFFGYDADQRSVVIGPAQLHTATEAPAVLEYGGTTLLEQGKKRPRRRVRIAARPYMGPAFEQEKPQLPALWRESVSG